ncbi:hypothetical protein BCV72DRAFT_4643 [Rhizopus microsporus var. microsporus]|uniref:Uncharacterized protein n=1 Tax=Rhizopus microsporus var. microsporus TaxID=86635 RepID=A0A1X0QZ76_RHIZD|nr:hypothetical protein BCV72DRAFT_4643 [Rhizopus microsporus var. microsporus]
MSLPFFLILSDKLCYLVKCVKISPIVIVIKSSLFIIIKSSSFMLKKSPMFSIVTIVIMFVCYRLFQTFYKLLLQNCFLWSLYLIYYSRRLDFLLSSDGLFRYNTRGNIKKASYPNKGGK